MPGPGERLGTRPPDPELCLWFTRVREVADVRDRFMRGDRVALEHTGDPDTRLRPGDEGTVTRYDPGPGQLGVRWDSGSTLSMLLNDGDRVRLITPAPGAGPGKPGRSRAGERLFPAARSPGGRAAPGRATRPPARPGSRVLADGRQRHLGRPEFYRDLLRGIASADPATTGLYEVPDLTGRWDYERGNLAADLGLAAVGPALDQAAAAYLAAAREEFWLEAARLGRRRLAPADASAGSYAGNRAVRPRPLRLKAGRAPLYRLIEARGSSSSPTPPPPARRSPARSPPAPAPPERPPGSSGPAPRPAAPGRADPVQAVAVLQVAFRCPAKALIRGLSPGKAPSQSDGSGVHAAGWRLSPAGAREPSRTAAYDSPSVGVQSSR